MNYVRIVGGLGNQMFQYAFGMSLKSEGKYVLFDISDFEFRRIHNGFELAEVFSIPKKEFINLETNNKVTSRIKRILVKKTGGKYKSCFIQPDSYKFYPEVYMLDEFYFDGYWQNLDYIKNISERLLNVFKFQNLENIDEKISYILNEILSTESVAVHIRGGDYIRDLKTSLYHAVVNTDYYEKAIIEILKKVENPVFFIFTNDISYAKNTVSLVYRKIDPKKIQVRVIPQDIKNNSSLDMFLMSKCKHIILANSSFSWWAGYLNSNDGLVLMPPRWTRFHKTENINLRKNENWRIVYY